MEFTFGGLDLARRLRKQPMCQNPTPRWRRELALPSIRKPRECKDIAEREQMRARPCRDFRGGGLLDRRKVRLAVSVAACYAWGAGIDSEPERRRAGLLVRLVTLQGNSVSSKRHTKTTQDPGSKTEPGAPSALLSRNQSDPGHPSGIDSEPERRRAGLLVRLVTLQGNSVSSKRHTKTTQDPGSKTEPGAPAALLPATYHSGIQAKGNKRKSA
jgi:hypothetical protein